MKRPTPPSHWNEVMPPLCTVVITSATASLNGSGSPSGIRIQVKGWTFFEASPVHNTFWMGCLGETTICPIKICESHPIEATIYKQIPSLKLTFSHLKMDGWNTHFFLGWPIFRGEPLVSGSVDGHQVPRVNQFWVAWESFYSLEGHYDQHFVHGDFQPEAAALGEAEKKTAWGRGN